MKDALQKRLTNTFSYASHSNKQKVQNVKSNTHTFKFQWMDNEIAPLSLTHKSILIDTDLTPPTEMRASVVRVAGIEQMKWFRCVVGGFWLQCGDRDCQYYSLAPRSHVGIIDNRPTWYTCSVCTVVTPFHHIVMWNKCCAGVNNIFSFTIVVPYPKKSNLLQTQLPFTWLCGDEILLNS